jgi:spore coat protein H
MSPIDHETKKQLDSGYEQKIGSKDDPIHLVNFIFELNTTPRNEYEQVISKHLNVEKYLKWLAGVVCTQNYDGFVHNYALYRNGNTNLFEVIPWDYDATWGRDIHGDTMEYDYVRLEGFNTLTARLLDIPTYKKMYAEILASILENQFTIEYMAPKVENLHNLLRPFVLQDPYIKHKIEKFDNEPEFIFQFIKDRNQYLLEKLTSFI